MLASSVLGITRNKTALKRSHALLVEAISITVVNIWHRLYGSLEIIWLRTVKLQYKRNKLKLQKEKIKNTKIHARNTHDLCADHATVSLCFSLKTGLRKAQQPKRNGQEGVTIHMMEMCALHNFFRKSTNCKCREEAYER